MSEFNAELAWDIQEWREGLPADHNMSDRESAKALATFLTEKGYHKGATGLKASVEYVEKFAQTIADEFIPAFEALRRDKS